MSLHYGRLGLMLLHKGKHICFKIYLYIHMIQYIKGKTCYQPRFNVKLHAPYSFALQPPRPWVTPVLQAKYSLYIFYQNHFLKI